MHDRLKVYIKGYPEDKEVTIIFAPLYEESARLTLTEGAAEQLIEDIKYTIAKNKEKREEDKEKIRKIDFMGLERELEKRYVKVPYIPSPSTLYGEGHRDGFIDDETYRLAAIYYGKLWNYCGD